MVQTNQNGSGRIVPLDVRELNTIVERDVEPSPTPVTNSKPTTTNVIVIGPGDMASLAPDGGYGWVVVLASFLCNLTVDGICYTFGIFLPHFIEHYGSNEAVTALTGSLLSGCYMTVGVFVSSMVNRFGCRPVAVIGSVVAAVALAVSTRAPTVYVLIVTYGIITGSSFGLIYLPSIVSVGHYFASKRAFATAIAVCGSGMGAFLFSPICQFLLSRFHWQQALLMLSGSVLACVLYGMLMKPLPVPRPPPPPTRLQVPRIPSGTIAPKSSNWSLKSRSTVSVNSTYSRRSVRPRTWTITSQMTEMEAVENRRSLRQVLDLSVLRLPAMALLSVSNVFGMVAYYIPYVYLVRFATEQLHIPGQQAAWLLSAVGIANVLGRLVFGLISDRFSGTRVLGTRLQISALFINNLCLMLAGFSVMVIGFCTSFWLLLLDSIVFGFLISSYMSLTSIILVDLLSLELLTTTFGLISCVRGLSSIVGPPLAGLLYETTKSYTEVFLAAGVLLCISSVLSFLVHRFEVE